MMGAGGGTADLAGLLVTESAATTAELLTKQQRAERCSAGVKYAS